MVSGPAGLLSCTGVAMHAAFAGRLHVTRHDQVLVITVGGEVDHEDAEELAAAWDAADQAGLLTTAVDLSRVVFADSMLLNPLLVARHRHAAAGRDFILLGPLQPAVTRLLTVSGTLEQFTIAGTGPAPISWTGGRPMSTATAGNRIRDNDSLR
ncbi:STAS domain-containing protein [Streptomyces sp. NPDC052301]|uniref:STAS domain-containing protein n=1 Tax=Streptomyces sp. NPDC052301 TaxID=3365687 RepID=UPI0037D390F5